MKIVLGVWVENREKTKGSQSKRLNSKVLSALERVLAQILGVYLRLYSDFSSRLYSLMLLVSSAGSSI